MTEIDSNPQVACCVFVNLGCGLTPAHRLPPIFRDPRWQEIRIDIDPDVKPDILASSENLQNIADGSVDAVYSSHSLEHLELHQVPRALTEMHRVLKPDGFALITLPDLQAVGELVANGKLTEVAYQSPVGPITALDMLFGHSASIAAGNQYMAHRCGFDAKFLAESLLNAGFKEVRLQKGACFDLWAYAYKTRNGH